ncbi:hypothetical protein BT63DRAFT_305052 [Microthyrium microscopicum]|uniref:Uncharacterized protein n=1 Tax=Microthyrium microscopicum TaxID=703497 RepID=A0A6A6U8J4_9PEZI|nr:hypothetical protein BT63DRAFT_305052 [Microthyrium microscopicum]
MYITSWQKLIPLAAAILFLFRAFQSSWAPHFTGSHYLASLHANISTSVEDLPTPTNTPFSDVDQSLQPSASLESNEPLETPDLTHTFDFIISYYKEDTREVRKKMAELKALDAMKVYTRIRTFIYVKDEKANLDELRMVFQTQNVFLIPNRGREAGAYFTHIINNWWDLADHNLFMQAELHHHDNARDKLVDYLRPNTGFLNIGFHEICSSEDCYDPWVKERRFSRIQEIYTLVKQEFCPAQIAIDYLGQIVVSRRRVQLNSRKIYQYLKDTLESEMDHPIHTDYHHENFQDTVENPYFGHTLERSYGILWDCHYPRIAETCGKGFGALVARRGPGDTNDDKCQCLDP